jgi:hypothetical protein
MFPLPSLLRRCVNRVGTNQYAINADGNRVPFLTDLKELDRRGSAGKVSFESLYARAS